MEGTRDPRQQTLLRKMARGEKEGVCTSQASVLGPQGGIQNGGKSGGWKAYRVLLLPTPTTVGQCNIWAWSGRRETPHPRLHAPQPPSDCPWLGHRAFTSLSMQAALSSGAEEEADFNSVLALYAHNMSTSRPSCLHLSHRKVFFCFSSVTLSQFFVFFVVVELDGEGVLFVRQSTEMEKMRQQNVNKGPSHCTICHSLDSSCAFSTFQK